MKTWIVDDNNNGDFSTIAQAVAAASTGDTIEVTGGNDGLHNEANIVVDKDITITSNANATIDAQGKGRIFKISDGNKDTTIEVQISNLVLTGGNVDGGVNSMVSGPNGGAISNREILTIDNITATGNKARDNGGAIYNTGKNAEITLAQSKITGNSAELAGGGIANDNGAKASLTGVNINDNTANYIVPDNFPSNYYGVYSFAKGGGIYNTGKNSQVTITQSNITGNRADLEGGGIANNKQAKASLIEVDIDGNTADFGGGIANTNDSEITVTQSKITGNSAKLSGGGIYSEESKAYLTGVNIDGNTADNGGGIANTNDSEITVAESKITGNSADTAAGGVYNTLGAKASLSGVYIDGNTAVYGGGIQSRNDAEIIVIQSEITNNTVAKQGGGISVIEKGQITIIETEIFGNISDILAGGIYLQNNSSANLENSNLTDNQAPLAGGIFSAKSNFTLNGSQVANNNSDILDNNIAQFDNIIVDAESGLSSLLEGTPKNDFIEGLDKKDTLSGLGGDDLYQGDEGADTFVVGANSGTDVIADFGNGKDVIGLSGGISFSDLTLSDNTIGLNGETIAIVAGVDTNTLTEKDFSEVEL